MNNRTFCGLLAALLACAGAPTCRAQTSARNALAFNGANQYVEIPNFGAIAPIDEVTVEFWAYTDIVSQQSAFMLEPDQGTNRFSAHVLYSNGNTYWDFGNILDGGRDFAASPPVGLKSWAHYAFVASHSGHYMRIYIDGSFFSGTSQMTPFQRGDYSLRIGGNTNFFFHGMIDEFRVWNTALSDAQIQSRMNIHLTGAEPNLLLYYPFDETNGTVTANAAIATGARYNGALINAPARVLSGASIAPYAPLVVTRPATAITTTSGTMNADVNPGSTVTLCYFQYGLSTNYGSSSSTYSLPATNLTLNVSSLLDGLVPLTEYHYRAVAANSVGTNYGTDMSFNTGSAFVPVTPAGARIYQQWVHSSITNPGQVATFVLSLNDGQSLSVAVTSAAGLWPSVQITDPAGAPFGLAIAAAPDQPAVLDSAPILLQGTYQLSVSDLAGATGDFLMRLVLNSGLEREEYFDCANNSLATVEDLLSSAIPVGRNGGEQMAVLGNLAGRPSQTWPDPADVYRLFLRADQSVTCVVASQGPGFTQVKLENGLGQVVALGAGGPTNVSQVIQGFVAPQDGYYFVAVTGDAGASYSLVVTLNAAFGLEPVNSLATSQSLTGVPIVSATLVNPPDSVGYNYYSVSANPGDRIHLQTATPIPGPAEIVNSFYPELLLFDPNGNLVAIANGNGSDGRNSVIDLTVPDGFGGTWFIEVTPSPSTTSPSQGDYFLTALGQTGTPPPLTVLGSDPATGTTVAPPTTCTLSFTRPISGLSLTPGELAINGIPASGVTLSGPFSATWTLPPGAIPSGQNIFNTVVLGADPGSGQRVASLDGVPTLDYSYGFNTSTSLTPPVAGPDLLSLVQDTSTKIPVSLLLGNDRTVVGGPLAIIEVNSLTGSTVSLVNGKASVAYTPSPGFVGMDQFTYTLYDGLLTTSGLVTVYVTQVGAPPFNHLAISGPPSNLVLNFSGIPGQRYAFQSAPTVTGPWTELFPTITAGFSGWIQYTNRTASPPPTRFFRTQMLR